ncbi:MAG: PhnA domain-containing protein [Planctomycetaceae bacterium]|nr:PhnA domain-containing protein [Planctomycetaceae bacterium]
MGPPSTLKADGRNTNGRLAFLWAIIWYRFAASGGDQLRGLIFESEILMSIDETLLARSDSKCELCGSSANLSRYDVSHAPSEDDGAVIVCEVCREQMDQAEQLDVHHWRCLTESMWSQVPAVQVLAWRMLKRLQAESWASDLLDTLYLEPETLAWAQAGATEQNDDGGLKHVDSNGVVLSTGDTVTLIKDLNVKGASFTAKRGTAVRGISLDPNNAEHIEGRVNGQQIVILTKFVKKS